MQAIVTAPSSGLLIETGVWPAMGDNYWGQASIETQNKIFKKLQDKTFAKKNMLKKAIPWWTTLQRTEEFKISWHGTFTKLFRPIHVSDRLIETI